MRANWGHLCAMLGLVLGGTGCDEGGKRPLGAACESSEQCASGLCYEGRCLDPLGDEDGDSLINEIEIEIGTDPFLRDSDGDRIDDNIEVGDDIHAPRDSDGDDVGDAPRHDALEPNDVDSDGDCISDQFDPEDRDITGEKIIEVCNRVGVCGGVGVNLHAVCEPAETVGQAPTWICDYTGVEGWDPGPDSICDSRDTDCDGETDEDYQGVRTTCGAAACTGEGMTACVDGAVVDSCESEPAADDATCNGVDDDCDGSTDEDYASLGTTCGQGPCAAAGTTSCVGGTVVDSCTPGTGAADDATCNGIDDDCDGSTDEDYGSQTTTCGVGACAATGTTSCAAGSVVDSCTPGAGAADDATCDGVDDDCGDGTDEDYVSVPTSCGDGACSGSGVTSCVGGTVIDSCSAGSGAPQDADCDGVDDDCADGTDEDYVPRGTTCGKGYCASSGVTSCLSGSEQDSCVPGDKLSETDATCDGVDDDCDGLTDEDHVPTSTSCGAGPCAATGTRSCLGGTEVDSCTPGTPGVDDVSCNGVDDDCNTKKDDGYVPMATSCGTGACAASGQATCVDGSEVDSCTPLTPNCGDAVCGGDGCGGSCGTCAAPTLPCLSVSCEGGQCATRILPSWCYIGGQCFAHNTVNAANSCQFCTDKVNTSWSTFGPGTACASDGNSCTTDTCSADGVCTHSPLDDYDACDDRISTTHGDWCHGGQCAGFEERLEPWVGTSNEVYSKGSFGAPAGVNATFSTVSLAGGATLWAGRYGSTLDVVAQALGSAASTQAVDPYFIANGNTLYELVDGTWTGAADTGSARAAWPVDGAPRYQYMARPRNILSFGPSFWAVGTDSGGSALYVRQCSRGSFCTPNPCAWTCSTRTTGRVKTDFPGGIAYFGGAPYIASNFPSATSPTHHRLLYYDPQQTSWFVLETPVAVADSRPLVAFAGVGGGFGTNPPPDWLIGAGADGLLMVTQLEKLTLVDVPALAGVDLFDVTQFDGHAVVVGRTLSGNNYGTVLAIGSIYDDLREPSSWRVHTLHKSGSQRIGGTLVAAADSLFVLGGAITDGVSRGVWRYRLPEAGTVTFEETFDSDSVPAGWVVVDQGARDPSSAWVFGAGVAQETGNCYDVDDDAIAKFGTFLWAKDGPELADGALRVDVRAVDNDGWGLMYGIQDEDTYYRVSFDTQKGFTRLVLVDRGKPTTLMEYGLPPMRNTWNRIEVVRKDGTHRLRINGNFIGQTVTDSSLSGGTVALYAWAMSDVRFDNLMFIK